MARLPFRISSRESARPPLIVCAFITLHFHPLGLSELAASRAPSSLAALPPHPRAGRLRLVGIPACWHPRVRPRACASVRHDRRSAYESSQVYALMSASCRNMSAISCRQSHVPNLSQHHGPSPCLLRVRTTKAQQRLERASLPSMSMLSNISMLTLVPAPVDAAPNPVPPSS